MKFVKFHRTKVCPIFEEDCIYVNAGWRITPSKPNLFEFVPANWREISYRDKRLTNEAAVEFISIVMIQQPRKVYVNIDYGQIFSTEPGKWLLNTLEEMSE